MKLTDEEIKSEALAREWTRENFQLAFKDGARFAESHYLPMIEAHEWLIIDTKEKREACGVIGHTDEWWTDDQALWGRWVNAKDSGLSGRPMGEIDHLFRRRISWHAVSETPIPKGVPVWLCFNGQVLLSQSGCENPHCDATHWRYASVPTPPIDPEREAMEKALKELDFTNGGLASEQRRKDFIAGWQAARSRKQE